MKPLIVSLATGKWSALGLATSRFAAQPVHRDRGMVVSQLLIRCHVKRFLMQRVPAFASTPRIPQKLRDKENAEDDALGVCC